MELRPGYKQTEVGVIPEDWNVEYLGKLGTFHKGHGVRKDEARSGVLPCVRYGEIYTHHTDYIKQFNSWISPEVALSAFKLRGGDLLFAGSGETKEEIGKCVALVDNIDAYAGGDIVILRSSRSSPMFLGYALNTAPIAKQKASFGQGDAVVHINAVALSEIAVALPPTLAEQSAIATALSDADSLIESLEDLIAKKRQIKQGAMQELLTGKRRLPGFSGTWEVKRLGEVADIRSGGTPSTAKPDFWDGDVFWCTPTDITALQGKKYLQETTRRISEEGLRASSAEMIPSQSIVMTSRATIGECAINMIPLATNQGFKNFVPLQATDVEFLYYLLCSQTRGFIALCAGSTFLEIGKTQVARYEVQFPSLPEQTAIATVLSDMDTELDALTAKLAKARQIKQGMMQELLTGRIRLI